MKIKHARILLSILLATFFFTLASTYLAPSVSANEPVQAALQETPQPPADDGSEIGSTDGILIMGVVIVLIVTIPLFIQKKK